MNVKTTTETNQSVSEVITKVAQNYGITFEALVGKNRLAKYVWPRQIAMYFLREYLHLPYSLIASIIGDRNHTTIMYGYQKVKHKLRENVVMRRVLDDLWKKIIE